MMPSPLPDEEAVPAEDVGSCLPGNGVAFAPS